MRGPDNRATASNQSFTLSSDDFSKLVLLIEKQTGLRYAPTKIREVQVKLAENLLSEARTGAELVQAASEDAGVLQKIVNCLTIGESYFFRNRPHFDALTDRVIPRLIENTAQEKKLRIWCAGCATGEEPYSIAILLRDKFPVLSGWDTKITATDINTGYLERAREGLYRKWSFRGVDDHILWKYFSREDVSEDEETYRLHADIRRKVDFKRLNLAEFPFSGKLPYKEYDLIICRNVLIYFSFQFANEIIAAFADVSRPGSYLFVGHSEAFPSLSNLDVIYSHATYYYRYHRIAGEQADRQSIAPGPSLSIPGIGVKTIVPKSPMPISKRQQPRRKPEPKFDISSPMKSKVNVLDELERARKHVNSGETASALELLSALAAGPGKIDYRVHFLNAIVSDQAGNVDDCIRSLKQSIFLKKDFAIGHFYLGVVHQRDDRNSMAIKCFRNAKNLVEKLPSDHILDEAEGLTAGRLEEIAQARFEEILLEQS
ncbi:MAG: protein-glutamate O-methyltransferase CheR [Deltaproteobacteria bacterium]|nr:protein-glutamate O-methyltransferase CheR [Deltaproteobacteria bacterium]